MPIKAGQIVIDVSAGTAKMVVDMEQAKAKIRELGGAAHGSVSGVQAMSGAIRIAEGNVTNNIRAVERFLATTLKLGPIIKAAFPVIGLIAFAGVLFETYKRLHEFFKAISDAPALVSKAFRELGNPLQVTNDQLAVTNARLENDIAKLEGKRQNNLKIALLEVVAAADKLAESLERDLAGINKIVKEQNVSIWARILGSGGTEDIKKEFGGDTGTEGFLAQINALNEVGTAKIRSAAAAKDANKQNAAQSELNTNLLKAYGAELEKVNGLLKDAKKLQELHDAPKHPQFSVYGVNTLPPGQTQQSAPNDQTARINELNGIVRQLNLEKDSINLQAENTALTSKKEGLEAARGNEALDRPFADRMKALGAELDATRAKLLAIGQPEWANNLLKSFEAGRKAVEEVNKALEKHHEKLTDAQSGQITLKELQIAQVETETTWRAKLEASTTSINDRIRSQEMLTAAIGHGYEATKKANVETQLAQELGEHINDAKWMQDHDSDVQGLRSKISAEYEAKHSEAIGQSVQKLSEQIELERSLAEVQIHGAEAVRLVTLAYRMRAMVAAGATATQIAAEVALYNAERANASSAAIATLEEKTEAVKRLTEAVFKGAEAQRQATLENKYAEMKHNGATPAEVSAESALDTADHQRTIAEEAAKTVNAYNDQLKKLADIQAALQAERKAHGDNLEIEMSLRDIEQQRLQLAVQEELKLRGAKDGLKAFFLEMQEDAKSAATIVYETLNSALDKTADQFSKLMTGKKTDFAKMFESIGGEMAKSSTKALLQKGLGKLGGLFGIHAPAGKPDGTENNPFYVVIKGKKDAAGAKGIDPINLSGGGAKAAASGLGGLFGGVGGFISHLFGGAGKGSANSSISYMADGGDMYPGNVYGVAEAGEAEVVTPRQSSRITPLSKLGGDSITYNIDAKNAELGVESRIASVIQSSHSSAVRESVHAANEKAKRSPHRSNQ